MRTDITNISIPTPCHEAWNKMTPSADARFCGSCAKTVIDFSAMSADQIISYLSTSQNTCGRFGYGQLDQMNILLLGHRKSDHRFLKRLTVGVAILFTTQLSVKAQTVATSTKTEQMPVALPSAMPTSVDTTPNMLRDVRGKVTDRSENLPLPGATVFVNGNPTTATDANGDFCIALPDEGGIVSVRFIGFEELIIEVSKGARLKTLEFALKESWLGEVMVVRPPLHKRLYYRFIKRPIKKIFG